MWFNSQGSNSMEEIISKQICAEPELVYAAELEAIAQAEAKEAQEEEEKRLLKLKEER